MYWKNAYKFTKNTKNLKIVIPEVKQVVQKIRKDPSYDLTNDYFRMIRKVYGIRTSGTFLATNANYEMAWTKWEAQMNQKK